MRASRTRSDSSLITHHSLLITHQYRTVTRFGTTTNGAFDPLAQFGGSLMQDHAIGPSDVAGLHAFSPDAIPSSNDRRASPHDAALRPRIRRRRSRFRLLRARHERSGA